jgi:peptidoglycan L-alanyl-D-glutamate endopeptidase CwlK
LKGLFDGHLADRSMVLMSLATIRAEAAPFQPIDEGISQFNTPPGGAPFSLYDNRTDLGNQGAGDGERFKGRGFVQLTGRSNYGDIGRSLGLGARLIEEPELANDPLIAARILATFLKTRESAVRQALAADDLPKARTLVNGGHHGLVDFQDAFRTGRGVLPNLIQIRET